jgi:hypothetical protein
LPVSDFLSEILDVCSRYATFTSPTHCGGTSGREQLVHMAGAIEHLTLELVEHPHGRCQAILTADNGEVLLDRIYKSRASASVSARNRLRKAGLGEASITRVTPGDDEPDDEPSEPEQAPVAVPASPGGRWLVKLRHEAQRVLDEAVKLRERAELLESEHKRLAAAADVLEGPEG